MNRLEQEIDELETGVSLNKGNENVRFWFICLITFIKFSEALIGE